MLAPFCRFSAGLPSSVRSRSGQRCSPSRNGRLARPCDRSAYTYTPSGCSPALLVSFSWVPPRCGPDRDRAWHLWSSSSRSAAPRPRAPLATAFGGSLRSGDTAPHTCAVSPTFRYGAFFFVESALADVSSASLTSCDRGHASIRR